MNYFDHTYPLKAIFISDWSTSSPSWIIFPLSSTSTAITVDVANVVKNNRNSNYAWVGLGQNGDGKEFNTYFGWIAVRKEAVSKREGCYSINEDNAFWYFWQDMNLVKGKWRAIMQFYTFGSVDKIVIDLFYPEEIEGKNI
jgi:hypothetical protein